LRFSTLGLQSFWYDEAATVLHVIRPHLGDTVSAIPARENTPPLYYLLAWVWSTLFGTGEAGLRSLSAVFGTLTVPVAWRIGTALFSRGTGIVLAALVAV